MNSVCKTSPDSAACNHWQREVCGRCPNWKFEQDQDHLSSSPAHKLMTTDECQRLKRELQASLFVDNRGVNPITYLLLLFFIVFCMALTVWLLAKAFVFKPNKPNKLIEVCQDRQSGGHASVDNIMKQLREKCTASAKMLRSDELYVPPRFWNNFAMKGFGKKSRSVKQNPQSETRVNIDDEVETDMETSDLESSESLTTEPLNESENKGCDEASSEETTSSTGEQTEGSTTNEDQTSITMDIQDEARKFTDSIGKMPTKYGPTISNPSNGQRRGKIRQNINSAECQQWMSEVFAHCKRLLADKQLEFWDDWWLNEPPVRFYQLPRLMSAYDCQKLQKEIDREVAAAVADAAHPSPLIRFDMEEMTAGWRILLVLFIICLALFIIGSMVWMLNSTLRYIAAPRFADCERQTYNCGKCYNKSPRSFISFGNPSNPLTSLGPYRGNKFVVPRSCIRTK